MKQVFRDMMDNELKMDCQPKRIVSTVPSQTELLWYLGLEEEVVGITKFCVHPESWFRSKSRVGGTKTLDIAKIADLHPDLIIANKEENTEEQIKELSKYASVWVSDIQSIDEALRMISEVGHLTGTAEKAAELVNEITQNFLHFQRQNLPRKKTAYFIWYKPWMSVGKDTFIHDMMRIIGLDNVFGDQKRYPEVSVDVLIEADPELVLLSSEPYPFKQKHVDEISVALPSAEIKLVDGEMFSWYGSRMLSSAKYFSELLHAIS